MKPWTPWVIIGTVAFIVAAIAGLGEWVFHWWSDPWQYVFIASASALVGFLSFATAATGRDVDRLHHRLDRGFGATTAGLDRVRDEVRGVREGQEEQTSLLRRLVTPFEAAALASAPALRRR